MRRTLLTAGMFALLAMIYIPTPHRGYRLIFSPDDTSVANRRGDPDTATKNGETRYVPMIPELEQMLVELRADRQNDPPTATVMRVFECQNSMTHAAQKIGMKRITHHDLRHLFATICIESGVDIPTVSRWLGHKDGGALCMKTYGHLRQDHSFAQAQRVSFGVAA
jgi:integrase